MWTLRTSCCASAGVTVSVADVLVAMGLAEVATSVVGGGKVRGISGGERKRLAIGCALLAEDMNAPLFADEPTSGLDSFQADDPSPGPCPCPSLNPSPNPNPNPSPNPDPDPNPNPSPNPSPSPSPNPNPNPNPPALTLP